MIHLAAIASIAISIAIDASKNFYVHYMERVTARYVRVDHEAYQAAPSGGLYLRFVNFRGNKIGFLTNYYFRDVYVLYPQRVLVGDPSIVINTPQEVLAANVPQTDAWLLAHGLTHALLYDRNHYDIIIHTFTPYFRQVGSH